MEDSPQNERIETPNHQGPKELAVWESFPVGATGLMGSQESEGQLARQSLTLYLNVQASPHRGVDTWVLFSGLMDTVLRGAKCEFESLPV